MKYQIIPNISIDNSKLIGMLENINYYRKPFNRLKYDRKEDELQLENQYITTYEIVISKDDIKFYLGFDDIIKDNFDTELNICYKHATFKESNFAFIGAYIKELELSEHYFLSLRTDLRGQWPLSNILETQNILKDNEDICIRLELTPTSPTWYRECDACIKRFNTENKVTNKFKIDTRALATTAVTSALDLVYEGLDFVNYFVDSENKIEREYPDDGRYVNLIRTGLSNDTLQKPSYKAYKTKFIILINSTRSDTLFTNIVRALNTMQGDNSFILTDKSNYKNILSTKELAQIMQMPTKEYQGLYKINNVNTKETEVPTSLLRGSIKIGNLTYRGNTKTVYWGDDSNVMTLPKLVIGPMGSGKDEYTKNFVIDLYKKGDGAIILDYIKDCELSNDIAKHVKCIKIDLSKQENIFALAYPELQPTGTNWDKLVVANQLSRQVEYLINSLVGEPLSSRMSRYLDAACKVVFIHEGAKVSDVIDVLMNWKIRNEYIRKAKYSGIFTEDDIEIVDLESLHDRDSNGKIIGTRESRIEHIMDRVNILLKDIYLRAMTKADIDYKYNFTKWIDEGKIILLQIPEHTFTNKQVKDTIVTYFMSRIWLATLQRKNHKKICHIITNEIHQVPTAAALVSKIITEPRKFGIDFYFTIHYLKQLKMLESAIRSAGANYMFLAGTEKENLLALQDELLPFTVEDGLNLKPFHSLNIINYGNQYAKFITKLPKPI